MIGLEFWPVGDWQTLIDRLTKSTDQYTWKMFDFASNKQANEQTNRQEWKYNLLLRSVVEVTIKETLKV